MIYILFLLPLLSFGQAVIAPIIDASKLEDESIRRTVFIKFFPEGDLKDHRRATGFILKGGLILTNEHVLRSFNKNKKTIYQISSYGKSVTYLKKVDLIACDEKNDICLLKTDLPNMKYFPLEPPSYRKITESNPVGLYVDEQVYFNGACGGMIEMKKARNGGYSSTVYDYSTATKRWGVDSIELKKVVGDGGATCEGDSGGPVFDTSLSLFGMVRDTLTNDYSKRSFALPANKLREFVEANKDKAPISSLNMKVD